MFGISDVLLPCGHGSGVKMYCRHVGTVVVLSKSTPRNIPCTCYLMKITFLNAF